MYSFSRICVFFGILCVSDVFLVFRDFFWALEAIGDYFGSFRTILFSQIFVDFRRVSSVGREKS